MNKLWVDSQAARPDQTALIDQTERRHFLATAFGCTLLAGLGAFSGCSNPGKPGLRIATNQWIGYELLYLSQALKSTQKQPEAADFHLVELLSNTDSVQALIAGTVDGAGLTLDEAIAARAAGLDLKIVLVFDFSAGADVLLSQPKIKDLASLRGKRIGVEQTGVGALMLDAIFKQTGLTAADVKVINLTIDQHLAAFRSQKVDALITFEPFAGQIEAQGGRRLFDSRSIPGSIVDVLVISAKALDANPEAARRLVRDYFQALTYLHSNPADAAQRMAPRLGLTPAAVERGYRDIVLPDLAENRRLLGGSPSPLEASAAKLAKVMLQTKLLDQPVDVKQLIVDTALPEATS